MAAVLKIIFQNKDMTNMYQWKCKSYYSTYPIAEFYFWRVLMESSGWNINYDCVEDVIWHKISINNEISLQTILILTHSADFYCALGADAYDRSMSSTVNAMC